MKVEKELAVKIERERGCYKGHCIAHTILFVNHFLSFLSSSVQRKPLEVGRAAIITTREEKQVP